MRKHWPGMLAAIVGMGLAACSPAETTTPEASPMQLTSSAFTDGAAIPAAHTCDGADASPPLEWTDVPEGVGAFALIVTDPDAGGFVHWVLADIPGDLRELPEGQGDAIGVPGRNDFGRTGWGGPCPPSGEHRYVFTLYALPARLGLGGTLTADAVRSAAEDVAVARAELTGVYRRG